MTFASFENVNIEIYEFVYSSLLQVTDIYSFSIFSFHKNKKKIASDISEPFWS